MAVSKAQVTPIVDGAVVDKVSSQAEEAKKKSSDNTLGKEAFLQLLVTQMKYQDPLNPQDDTDFIAQLAQFSTLEQLQNLNKSFSDTGALNMVGKTAMVKWYDAGDKAHEVTGIVDYVTKSGKEMKASINGTLYSVDDIYAVYDASYVVSKKLPSVEEQKKEFLLHAPSEVEIDVNVGEDEYKATAMAVIIGDRQVDSEDVSYKDGKLTIDRKAMKDLEAGTYNVTFVFTNASYSTTVSDKVTLEVKGTAAEDVDS